VTDFLDLTGKAALVTGGARGLGLDIVRTLARAGASVMMMDFREAEGAEAKANVGSEGHAVDFVQGDVRSAADAARAVDATRSAFGSIDILVNNAGVFSLVRLDRLTEEEWDRIVDLKGTHLMCQAAMRAMLDQSPGPYRMVNIASTGGIAPGVSVGLMAHYNAAKAGVIAYTAALAKELMDTGIRVNAVAPGNMGPTPGNLEAGASIDATPEQIDKVLAVASRAAETTTGEVARMVLALASPLADGMRGQTVVVDGGFLSMP
jgi:NAD(P)-dependent dehydrogenase (short-subunit alcohol dehydrogenase family)